MKKKITSPFSNLRLRLGVFVGAIGVSLALLALSPFRHAHGAYTTRRPNCGTWDLVYSPNPNDGPAFFGVTAVPMRAEAWAIGNYVYGYYLTLIEHWDGTSWQIVSSPNYPYADHYLYGVAAISSNDVWAVGRYAPSVSPTLILHWDGISWSIVSSPSPSQYSGLYAVAGRSANDVWAVGYDYSPTAQRTLIEHWDGSSWSIVPSPNVGEHDNLLRAVAVVPNSQTAWAAGYYYRDDGRPSTLVLRWDGATWSVVASADGYVRENYLTSVSSSGPDDAWVVGFYNDATGNYVPLTEHWDGTTWEIVPSPSLSSSLTALTSISSISSTDVWAVGSYYNDDAVLLTLAQHWDGTSWQVFTTPNPAEDPNAVNTFTSVASTPGIGVWAVGYYQIPFSPSQSLTAFYCQAGGPTPTPSPTPTATATATISPTVTPTATATARPFPTPRPHPRPRPRP